MHTHTSVHTHSRGFPGLEIGCFGIWAIQAYWILPDPKSPTPPVHTSQGAHSSCHTCVTLLSHTTYSSALFFSELKTDQNSYPGAFSGHCSIPPPPYLPLKPSFLFSFSEKIEWQIELVFSDTPKGFLLFPLFSSTLPTCCLSWPTFKSLPGCAQETTNYPAINPLKNKC